MKPNKIYLYLNIFVAIMDFILCIICSGFNKSIALYFFILGIWCTSSAFLTYKLLEKSKK